MKSVVMTVMENFKARIKEQVEHAKLNTRSYKMWQGEKSYVAHVLKFGHKKIFK